MAAASAQCNPGVGPPTPPLALERLSYEFTHLLGGSRGNIGMSLCPVRLTAFAVLTD